MSGSASMLCILPFTSRLIRAMACSPGRGAHSQHTIGPCTRKALLPAYEACANDEGRVCITIDAEACEPLVAIRVLHKLLHLRASTHGTATNREKSRRALAQVSGSRPE